MWVGVGGQGDSRHLAALVEPYSCKAATLRYYDVLLQVL